MARDLPPMLRESRVTRAEALARTLESEIVGATFSPGQRIGTKDELRQRFGVAVATMNEAVRMMEMRGLVVARPGPGGGVFVTNPSARASASQLLLGLQWGNATLADCVEVRNALEPLICRRAADDHRAADIRELRLILAKMQDSTADPHAYFRVNWEFHRRVAMVGRNPPLQSIYLVLSDFLESGLSDLEFEFIAPGRVAVHRRLLAAIESGDDRELEAALAEHAALSPLTSDTPP
jgi:DNA-binding FadR family transcriptional regulator